MCGKDQGQSIVQKHAQTKLENKGQEHTKGEKQKKSRKSAAK